MDRLYWLRGHNFGDVLNPILFRLITGQEPVYADTSPKVVAIGSLMHTVMPYDVVWGAGVLDPDLPIRADQTTTFLAVRGPLTARILRAHGFELPDIIYGDPSLLLPRYFPMQRYPSGPIGFMPHYIDYGQVRALPSDVVLLNPAAEPLRTIEEMNRCRAVVASSLHGVCVAEAYGIPALWVRLSDNVPDFKFRDYYASTGREVEARDWRRGYRWQDAEGLKPAELGIDLDKLLAKCPYKISETEYHMDMKSAKNQRAAKKPKIVTRKPEKKRKSQADQARQTGG